MSSTTVSSIEQLSSDLLKKVERFAEMAAEIEAAGKRIEEHLEHDLALPVVFWTAVRENLDDYRSVHVGANGSCYDDPASFVQDARNLVAIVNLAVSRRSSEAVTVNA